jgi:hypothetical protein
MVAIQKLFRAKVGFWRAAVLSLVFSSGTNEAPSAEARRE